MATMTDYVLTLEDAVAKALEEENKIAVRTSFDGKTGIGEPGDPLYEAAFKNYMDKLKKAYPYDKNNKDLDKTLNRIKMFPAEDLHAYLQQFGSPARQAMSPTEYYRVQEASKILPLLQGIAAKGNDWYSMSSKDLKEAGLKAGFPVEYQSGYADFLNQIADMQTTYDRSKLLKDAQDSTTAYTIKKLLAPTAWKEFENALASGGDYDKGDAVRSGAIDALANSAIIGGPTAVARIPGATTYAVNLASPLVQMLGETGRQLATEKLSKNGVEGEVAPILTTGAAGATIPALVGSVQRLVSKIPGKKAQQFARGLAKANKAGDPVDNETEDLVEAVKNYNKGIETSDKIKDLAERLKTIKKSFMEMDEQPGVHSEVLVNGEMRPISEMNTNAVIPMELGPALRLVETNKVPDYAKALGITPKNGVYSANDILSAYKKPINTNIGLDDEGKFFITEGNDLLNIRDVPTMSPAQLKTYQSLFPARYAEAAASDPHMRAGYAVGSKLGDYGGMLEATLKPVDLNDLVRIGTGEAKPKSYQQTNVYKENEKLAKKYNSDKRNPKNAMNEYLKAKNVKDLFDLVFKKKEEDEEE